MHEAAAANGDLHDRERAQIAAFANLIAAVTWLAVDWHMGFPPIWSVARLVGYIGLGVSILFFAGLGGALLAIRNAIRRAKSQSVAPPGAGDHPAWIYVGSGVNAILIGGLILLTGGIWSPLAGYAGAFVIFGQFLASTTRATVLCVVGGLLVLGALAWYPSVAQIAGAHAVTQGWGHAGRMGHCLAIVGGGAILIGVMCARARR